MAILKNLITIGDAQVTNDLFVEDNINVGYNNQITGENSAAFGKNNIIIGNYVLASGSGNKAVGNHIQVEGCNNYGHGSMAHAEGDCTQATSDSHAEGIDTFANNYAHAEGNLTMALGKGAHTEGYNTVATGFGAHAEGFGIIYDAISQKSSLFNNIVVTSVQIQSWDEQHDKITISCSNLPSVSNWRDVINKTMFFQFGQTTNYGTSYIVPIKNSSTSYTNNGFEICTADNFLINNNLSILPNLRLIYISGRAEGTGAHAEGYNTAANGDGAHAEGYANSNSYIKAGGIGAHAGGYASNSSTIIASGAGSLAHGYGNVTADASGAIALGIGAWADQPGMCAVGSYNASTGNANTLFAIGAGSWHGGRRTVFRVTAPSGFGTNVNCSVGVEGAISVSDKVYAANGFFQVSDANKKNIISDIDLNKAYDLIDKCQTIIYTLKDDKSNREQIGMIAQEVQEFFPEIIENYEDGSLTIDYSKLTVIILRVLKDLIKKVDDLLKNK